MANMRRLAMSLLTAGVASAPFTTTARAESPSTETIVHIDSPEPVELGRRTERDGEFSVVCTSPCDKSFSLRGTYRIQSARGGLESDRSGTRLSDDFSLSPKPTAAPRETIAIEPASRTDSALGLGLVVLGSPTLGVGMVTGLVNFTHGFNDGDSVDQTGPLIAISAGIVMIVAGVILMVETRLSKVTIDGRPPPAAIDPPESPAEGTNVGLPLRHVAEDTSARTETIRVPAAVSVPLLRMSF
jgi:hypothetical protein